MFYRETLGVTGDDFLFRTMSEHHPHAIATAERVRAFVRGQHDRQMPDEEVAYLALHVARAVPE